MQLKVHCCQSAAAISVKEQPETLKRRVEGNFMIRIDESEFEGDLLERDGIWEKRKLEGKMRSHEKASPLREQKVFLQREVSIFNGKVISQLCDRKRIISSCDLQVQLIKELI